MIVENDPVLAFIKRVRDEARKDPLWNENYPLATYKAFSTATSWHVVNHFERDEIDRAVKYINDGKGLEPES